MSDKIEDTKLIAYCGLYCNDCHAYNGRIPDLARDLRKELREAKYDKFAGFMSTIPFGKDFESYEKCYKVLGAMVKFRCRRGCRNGGGDPRCKIRICVQRKKIDGCWECNDFKDCKKLDFLRHVHGDAHIKNLRKIKKNGKKEFTKGKTLWYNAEKKK